MSTISSLLKKGAEPVRPLEFPALQRGLQWGQFLPFSTSLLDIPSEGFLGTVDPLPTSLQSCRREGKSSGTTRDRSIKATQG